MTLAEEVTHQMGLVPLVWLAGLHLRGQRRAAQYWWLAAALLVSWLADTASHFLEPGDRWPVVIAYPVLQSSLAGAVFLGRRERLQFVAALVVVGVVAILWRGAEGPDVVLSAVASLGVAGIVVDRWALGRMRTALLVYFGLGWVCLVGYALWPGYPSWAVYQIARAAGMALFCWACLHPAPSLTLERA